jgi:hypothetical protein
LPAGIGASILGALSDPGGDVATFDNFEQLKDEKTAKGLIKKALDKVKPSGLKFLYYEKFSLGGKDVPLVLVDYGPALQGEIKKQTNKAPSAVGRCFETAAGSLAFEAEAGTVKQAPLKKFLGTISGMREIADADEAAVPAPKSAPRTVDEPVKPTSAAPSGEAQKRLAAFTQSLKALPADLRESFEMQRDKAQALLAKGDEPAALKLLGQLEGMVTKAASGKAPEVDVLQGVLAARSKAVDEALQKLPADAGSLSDDLLASNEYKLFAALRKSPSSAPDASTLAAAGDKLLRHVEAQVKLAEEWKQYKTQSTEALKKTFAEALLRVGKDAQASLRSAFEKCSERAAYAEAVKDTAAYRKRDAIDKLKATMLARLSELEQIELRRARAKELVGLLGTARAPITPFVQRCTALIGRIDANPGPVELSWRSATVTGELGTDRSTVDAARTAAQQLDSEIGSALTALALDPPEAVAIAAAEKTQAKTLANIDAAEKRAKANLAKTSPDGRETLVRVLLDAAKTDPARLLSSDRAGRVGSEAKKNAMTRDAVIAAIAAEVTAQHNPPLRTWLKVLQLNAVKGGEIRLASRGSVNIDMHSAKSLHMTLYIKNVDSAPPISAGAAAILDALLPDVDGNVGTHVTLEYDGPISKNNPHVFKGEPAGRANGLAKHDNWTDIRDAMQAKLDGELTRLRDLIQAFIARGGKFTGE